MKNPQSTFCILTAEYLRGADNAPSGMKASWACASLAAKGKYRLKAARDFFNMPLRTDKRRYYDNCLYFFTLLALSGNYKIY
jgi:oligosaccharide reducing-end xylanase